MNKVESDEGSVAKTITTLSGKVRPGRKTRNGNIVATSNIPALATKGELNIVLNTSTPRRVIIPSNNNKETLQSPQLTPLTLNYQEKDEVNLNEENIVDNKIEEILQDNSSSNSSDSECDFDGPDSVTINKCFNNFDVLPPSYRAACPLKIRERRRDPELPPPSITLNEMADIEKVVNSLKMSIDTREPIAARQMSLKIADLCKGGMAKQAALGDAGACALVTSLLWGWLRDIGALEAALLALSSLCQYGESKSTCFAPNIVLLGAAGAFDMVVGTMQRNLNNDRICEKGALALGRLALEDEQKKALGLAGACDVLISALDLHLKNNCVVEQIVTAMMLLSQEKGNVYTFSKLDLCKLLVVVLSTPDLQDELITVATVASIGNLAQAQESIEGIAEAQGCFAVVDALTRLRQFPKVAESCCLALGKLSFYETFRNKMADWRACDSVTLAFKVHLPIDSVTYAAFVAIAEMSYNCQPNVDKFRKINTLDLLIEAIAMHSIPSIDEIACGAIFHMCFEDPEVITYFGNKGICPLIVSMLDRAIQWSSQRNTIAASNVIWILSYGNSANQASFGIAGACRLLVSVLDGFSEDAQIRALWAITALNRHSKYEDSVSDVNIAHILMASGHSDLISLLVSIKESVQTKTMASAELAEATFWAIRSIVILHPDAFGKHGCQILLDVFFVYHLNARVAAAGCSCIRWLAESTEIAESTLGPRMSKAMLSALEEHPEAVITCESACAAIVKLSAYESAAHTMVSGGICPKLIAVMEIHATNVCMVVAISLAVKGILVGDRMAACESFSKYKIVDVICQAFQLHPDNTILMDTLCYCVYTLCLFNSILLKLFNDANTGEYVKTVFRDHMTSRSTTLVACRALWAVASGPVNKRLAIADGDCASLLVKCVQLHLLDSPLQHQICHCITVICKETEIVEWFSDSEICVSVMAILQLAFNRQDEVGIGLAAQAITALCKGNPKNQGKLGALGTCELIVNCLFVSWIKELTVTENLLYAVAYLCRSSAARSSTNIRNMNLLISGGAVKAAVSGLRHHTGSVGLSKAGCIAIRNLAYDSITKSMLGAENACELVYKSFTEYGGDVVLVEYAAGAVANLAGPLTNLVLLANLGVYKLISRKLEEYIDYESVTIACCGAIINLTAGSDDEKGLKRQQQDRFMSLEIHEMLVAVLMKYKASVNVAIAACGAVTNLTEGHTESATVFGAIGACEIVANILAMHGEDREDAATSSCSAIWCLAAASAKNKRKFGNNLVCENVVQVLLKHIRNPSLAEHACLAIRHLAEGNSENSAKFGGAGACEAVIKVLNIHVGDTSVAEAASGAVVSLSVNNRENAKRLGSFGASDEVVRSLQKALSSRDEALASTTSSAITRLINSSPENQQALGTAGACELLVKVLESWEKKRTVDTAIINAIATLCRFGSERSTTNAFNVSRLIKAGAFEVILKTLTESLSDSDICDSCCFALRNLAFEQDQQYRLGVMGGCDLFIQVLRTHIALPNVTEKVCGAISSLALVTSNAAFMAKNGVFSLLGQAFGVHLGILDTALAICGAVVNLTANGIKESALVMETSGIFRSIVKALGVHMESVNMGISVTIAISNLIDICEGQSQDEFLYINACEVTLAVVHQHSSNAKAVSSAFSAIYHLAYEKDAAKDRFGMLGACELIVRTLLKHFDDEDVCQNGCLAIRNLAANHSENKSRLGGVGGCHVVIQILEKHPENLVVAEAACLAVRNLSGNHSDNVVRFGEAGACKMLLSVFLTHVSSPTVCEQTCASLANLVANNDLLKEELGQYHASDPITVALQLHGSNSKIAAHVCLLLANMCGGSAANGQQLLGRGACEALVAVLNNNISSGNVSEHACSAISGLCFSEESTLRLTAAGACEVVLATMFQHLGNHSGVTEFGCNAVTSLVEGSVGANIPALLSLGISRVLIESLRNYEDDGAVVIAVCQCIVKLGVDQMVVKELVELGVCEILISVISSHVASAIVLVSVFDAIYSLSLFNNTAQLSFGDNGICPLVNRALLDHQSQTDLIESVSRSIIGIASNEKHRVTFGRIGVCTSLVLALVENMETISVVSVVCQAISYLADHNEANCRIFLTEHTPDIVYNIFVRYNEVDSIMETATRAVWKLSEAFEDTLIAFTNLRVALFIVENLKNNSSHSSILCEASCGAVACLCKKTQNSITFRSMGVNTLLPQAIQKYEDVTGVVAWASRAVTSLTEADPSNAQLLHEADIALCLLLSLRKHVSNAFATKEICSAISALVNIEPSFKLDFNYDTISSLISEAFHDHSSNMETITEVCCAIASLGTVLFPLFENTVMCKCLVDILRRGMKNRGLVSVVCLVVAEVVANSATVADIVGGGGGCETVVLALRTHILEIDILCRGSLAIDKLATNSESNMKLLRETGAPEVLVQVLVNANLFPLSIPFVCGAIRSLTNGNTINKLKFGTMGACESLLSLLQSHRADHQATISISSVLRCLVIESENRSRLCVVGGCEIVWPILEQYQLQADVLAELLGLLSVIAVPGSTESRQLSSNFTACNSLVVAVRNHSTSSNLVTQACRLIHSLVDGHIESSHMMGSVGICELMGDALMEHVEVPETIEQICFAAGYLCIKSPQNIVRFQKVAAIESSVIILRKHFHRPLVTTAACFLIRYLAGDDKTNEQLSNLGACELILEAFAYHIEDHVEVCAMSCWALRRLIHHSSNNSNLLRVAKGQGCPIIIRALRRHLTHVDFAGACLWLIRVMSKEVDVRNELGDLGACEIIIAVLETHRLSKWVVAQTFWAINSLSFLDHEENLRRFSRCDSHEVIVSTLRANIEVTEVVEQGMIALSLLGKFDIKNCGSFVTGGACEVVVEGLSRHLASPAVVEQAITAIRVLLQDTSSIHRFTSVGAVRVVVEAGKVHIDHYEVAEQLCQTVAAFIAADKQHAVLFGDIGTCDLISDILAKHSRIVTLLTQCCRAVSFLSNGQSMNATVLGSGTVPSSIVAALQKNFNSAVFCTIACNAIHNLCQSCPPNAIHFGQLGVCDLVVTVLVKYRAVVDVVEPAMAAIWVLSTNNNDNKDRLGAANACEEVVTVLKEHIKYERVALVACAALWHLADGHPSNRHRLDNISAASEVQHVLKLHLQKEEVTKQACGALWSLLVNTTDEGTSLDGCRAVVNALILHMESPGLAEVGCVAMANMHSNLASIGSLGVVGACSAVIQTMNAHMRNPAVVGAVCSALCTLSLNSENKDRLGNCGACQVILNTLQVHVDKVDTASQILRVVAKISESCPLNATKFLGINMCDLLSLIIKLSPESSQLAERCCEVILSLADALPEQLHTFGELGMCDIVVTVMKTQTLQEYAPACEQACKAACHLALEETNMMKLLDNGVLESAILMLSAFTGDTNIVLACSKLTTFLTRPSTSYVTKNQALFAESGVCEALVRSMGVQLGNCHVVQTVCEALCNLGYHNAKNVELIFQAGVAAVVTAALSLCEEDTGSHIIPFAVSVCALISLTCTRSEHQEGYFRAQAGNAVAKVFQRAVEDRNEKAAENISKCIVSLIRGNADNQQSMGTTTIPRMIVAMLWGWVQTGEAEEAALWAAAYLCRHGKSSSTLCLTNVSALRMAGIYDGVIGSMRRYSNEATLIEAGCWVLRNLASEYEQIPRLGGAGACETVFHALSTHIENSQVVEAASGAIANLATSEECNLRFAKTDICSNLFRALQLNYGAPDVAANICAAIQNLSTSNAEIRELFGKLGIVSVLMTVASNNLEDLNLMLMFCGAVDGLSIDNERNKAEFGRKGACEVIVKSLIKFSHFDTFVSQSFGALKSLMEGCRENSLRVGECGGCESIVIALEMHLLHEVVAVNGCLSIRHLAVGSDNNTSRLGDAGAPDIVIKALKQHGNSVAIAEAASWALRNIAANSSTHSAFGELTACEAIVTALKSHIENAVATEQHFAAVANLTCESIQNIQIFFDIGIAPHISEALKRHAKVAETIEQVCHVVKIMSTKVMISKYFGDIGICECVVGILRRHIGVSSVAASACLAISTLALDENNVILLGGAGACEAISTALQHGNTQKSDKLANAACEAIVRLTAGHSSNQDAFGMAGACRYLCVTLSGWIISADILERVLWAVALLCRHGKGLDTVNEFNCTVFSEHKIDDCVAKILQRTTSTPKLVEAAAVAISGLSFDNDTKTRFGELGVCSILPILLLQYGESDNRVAEASAAAIATLATIHENKMKLCEASACDSVLTVLATTLNKYGPLGASTTEQCCSALQNLSSENKLYVDRLGQAGVCEVLVIALNSFLQIDMQTIFSACGAISNISSSSDENKMKFCNVGVALGLVQAMQLYDSDVAYATVIARAIRAITAHRETPSFFVNEGVCDVFVKALRKHIKSASVAEQIGGAMANILAGDDRSKNMFDSFGICETIVSCMRRHSDSAAISGICCRVIGHLAKMDDIAMKLGGAGACESVTNSLRRYSQDVLAGQQGCFAVRYLARDTENRSMLVLAGVCELVTATLRRYQDNKSLTEHACGAIFHLCDNQGESNTKLGLAGALELVVASLKHYSEVSAVVEQACHCLCSLSNTVSRRLTLGGLGACSAVLAALEAHLYDEAIVVPVTRAITYLSTEALDNQTAFGANKACELLIKVSGIHRLKPNVMIEVCLAVYRMSSNNLPNAKRFGEAGGCDGVISALSDHQELDVVCSAACEAVIALSCDSSNVTHICTLRISEKLCTVLRCHLPDPLLVTSVCKALSSLAKNESQQQILRNNGACTLAVDALQMHSNDISVFIATVNAIASLSLDASNATAMGLLNICQHVNTYLEHYRGNAEVISHLTYTVFMLLNSPHNCVYFGVSSMYKILVENMQLHGNDIKVALNTCLVLQKLSHSEEQRAIAGTSGVCECLVNVLLNHSNNKELIVSTSKALVCVCDSMKTNIERAGGSGVCELVMSILRKCNEHSEVCAGLFEVIKTLGISSQNKEMFGGTAGCETIRFALHKHSADNAAVRFGCEAIVVLCGEHAANKACFGSSDLHSTILQAMQKHVNTEATIGSACAALWSLASSNSYNTGRIAEAGAVAVLSEALRRHGGTAMVCGAACAALGVILEGNDIYLASLKAVDARRAAVAVLGVHFDDSFASQHCLHLLRVMYTVGKEPNLQPCEGECATITKCLLHHVDNSRTAEEACTVMSLLATNADSNSTTQFGTSGGCEAVCGALERAIATKSVSLASAACQAVLALCRGNAVNQDQLGSAGACRQVVTILGNWTDNPSESCLTETVALKALVYLCRYDKDKSTSSPANIARFRAAGSCEAVLIVLEKRVENPTLAEWSCRGLAYLAGDETCCTRLIGSGACEQVTRALRTHQDHPGVMEYACGAIANLCTTEESKLLLAAVGACEAVSSALFKYPQMSGLSIQACSAIANLAVNSNENKSRLGGAGACKAVTLVLQGQQDNVTAILASLGCMVNLVSQSVVNADRLIASGVCETLIQTAEKYQQNDTMCTVFFSLIRLLSNAPDRRRILTDVGACRVCCNALRRHITVANIAGLGCAALAALCEGDIDNMMLLGSIGVCQLAVEALISHSTNQLVAESSCGLILSLASKNSENRTRLISAGAPDAIIRVLEKNLESPEVAAEACHAVRFLACDTITRAKLSVAGACVKVVLVLKHHINNVHISTLACSAIYALAYDSPENRTALSNAGACEVVASVLQAHFDHAEASKEACLSIFALTENNPTNLTKLSTRSVALSVASVFQRHKANVEFAEAASLVLKNIAFISETRSFLGRNGACQPLVDSLTAHISNPNAVKAIAWAIYWIASDDLVNSETLGVCGACEALTNALLQHVDSGPQVEACISAIWMLACHVPSNKSKLGQTGACDMIVKILAKYISVTEITKPALVALRNLSSNSAENKTLLGNSGACAVVVRALSLQTTDAAHVEQACGLMANLANSNISNANMLLLAGAAEVLEDVLKSFVGNGAIMRQACLVVCHIASAGANPERFWAVGIGGSIVRVLSSHVNTNTVSAAACAALRALSALCDSQAKLSLGQSGACIAVTKALAVGLESQDSLVIEESVHAIYLLTRSCPQHQEVFGGNGMCELIARALKGGFSLQVSEKALWTAAYLMRHDADYRSTNLRNVHRFTELNICNVIMSLLQHHENRLQLILAGSLTIRNLCSVESNVIKIGQLKGCEIMEELLRLFHQEEAVCEAVCSAIANLAKGDCKLIFHRIGICQLIAQLLLQYMESPPVLEQICGSISNLGTECQENKTSFGNADTCETIVRVLRKHAGIPTLTLRACSVVWNLASNNTNNKLRLGAAGACEMVVNIQRTYATNNGIKDVCSGALRALSTGNEENLERIKVAGGAAALTIEMKSVNPSPPPPSPPAVAASPLSPTKEIVPTRVDSKIIHWKIATESSE